MAAQAAALIIAVLINYAASQSCVNTTGFSANMETVLAEYDRAQPPGAAAQEPAGAEGEAGGAGAAVQVAVSLDIRHATVDEATSTMRALADLHLQWLDPRLSWNTSLFPCGYSQTAAERLWAPDVALLNGAATSSASVDLPARISSIGLVQLTSRLEVHVPVSLELAAWPQDLQQASFTFGSRTLTKDEVELSINSTQKFYSETEFGSWRVRSVAVLVTRVLQENHQSISWRVTLQRRAAAHGVATGAVLALSTLQLAAALLLPLDERTPLFACAALTAALWMISALLRLPPAGSTPLVMSLMSALCVSSAVACICAALVRRVAKFRVSPPGVVRSVLLAASGVFKLTPDEGPGQAAESGAWAAAALLLDRLLSAVLLFTLFVIVCVYVSS
ncbi:hypothetical protein JYU34_009094 [Plutella xylostella]|uniref:Neurotransmitter-gated ion-channel ligand-binding domain-containing protein n=1 Tax=Plutella xylostella TaxID=51655 RepID=A0ABQ7QMM5_PLUXY|nr:hypothetical protein JYU34_009094 [Plutella xylostella]